MEKHQVIKFTVSDNNYHFLMTNTAHYLVMYLVMCLNDSNYSLDTPEQIIHEFWNLMHVDKELLKYFNKHLKIEILNKLPDYQWDNSETYFVYFDYEQNHWAWRCE